MPLPDISLIGDAIEAGDGLCHGIMPAKFSDVIATLSGDPSRASGDIACGADRLTGQLGQFDADKPFQITDAMRDSVENLREVAPGFMRSGLPTEEGLTLMKEAGLKSVVVLRHSEGDVAFERQIAERLGLNFEHIRTNGEIPLTRHQAEQFFAVVKDPEKVRRCGTVCMVANVPVPLVHFIAWVCRGGQIAMRLMKQSLTVSALANLNFSLS